MTSTVQLEKIAAKVDRMDMRGQNMRTAQLKRQTGRKAVDGSKGAES